MLLSIEAILLFRWWRRPATGTRRWYRPIRTTSTWSTRST